MLITTTTERGRERERETKRRGRGRGRRRGRGRGRKKKRKKKRKNRDDILGFDFRANKNLKPCIVIGSSWPIPQNIGVIFCLQMLATIELESLRKRI
jgi:hypothetical protein